jgi:hypothetical protein
MISALSPSAAACSAATSSTARKAFVGLAEADLCPLQLLLDKAVAVEVIAGLKRKERVHPHDDRAQNLVTDVEIIVGEPAALPSEDAVIGVFAGVFRHADAKARTLFHALEDKVDTVGVLPRHAALPRQNVILLAHALLGPLDRQPMITGKGLHPGLVVGGALAEDLLADRSDTDHPGFRRGRLLRKKCTTCSGRDKPLR